MARPSTLFQVFVLGSTLLLALAQPALADVVAFSAAFNDDMVLQRAPQKAAVYGTTDSKSVSVKVQPSTGSSYDVAATINNGTWKALLNPTKAAKGTTFVITATTAGGSSASLQKVNFGDVWYCGGQSNMALPILHTLSRNISEAAIKAGKYSNVRIHGIQGNMNPHQNWTSLLDAVNAQTFFKFSSTCYYFAQSLSEKLGKDGPMIGVIHTSFGGSRIEQWMKNDTVAKCTNATLSSSNQEWWNSRVLPYSQTTLKGFVWYQGENNMHADFGNSNRNEGYSCLAVELIKEWRQEWSKTPGTTDPTAPFGLVTLAPSGSEGGNDMGTMRWAQTGGYGYVPNPAMPNTFEAHAYDLNDPWANITCYKVN